MGKVETIWAWGDLMNGLQVFPNLVGLIGLSGVAAAALRPPAPKLDAPAPPA
jgi:AGCS family alanine or glycine:cation symporter